MELSGPDNTTFLLDIDGYQYPHLINQSYNSDWLHITIRVRDWRGPWSSNVRQQLQRLPQCVGREVLFYAVNDLPVGHRIGRAFGRKQQHARRFVNAGCLAHRAGVGGN